MKRLLVISLLGLVSFFANAQRFYYVEEINGSEVLIKEKLRNASQFVIDSRLASDYILKTTVASPSGNQFSLKITVIDTLSFKTVLEAEEKYTLHIAGARPKATIPLAIQTMIEKNLREIILAGGRNQLQMITKELRAKKDKT
ncbi:MAG: hypothetical protein ACHQEM_03840 [Chitinophagales bacterium]